MTDQTAAAYVSDIIRRARAAHAKIEFASQEDVDLMVKRLAWAGVRPDFAEDYALSCAVDTGMGYGPDKVAKQKVKVRGALHDTIGKKTVGVVYDDPARGIKKIAKPVGVVGALIPVTNAEATPFVKALFAIKTRNAVVLSPHPKAQRTNDRAVAQLRATLTRFGWPTDLIIGVEDVTIEKSGELMKQCDLVLATGGGPMVRAAYSSGTPSQGVGAGNAVSIVDETADLADAAQKIMRSKTFDHATSCSTENSLLIDETVYSAMIEELERVGGYLVTPEEKRRLQETVWTDRGLNREIVAQPAARIARLAGIDLPEGKSFLLVPETGIGDGYPFSGEKLSVICAVYRYARFSEAVDMVNQITAFSGPGHSCGIHTADEARVLELATAARVSRVMIRQPQCLANSGAWTNGMPMSLTLGCGSWGGTSTSSNVTWEHLLNYTWVSYPIPSNEPTDEDLFGDVMNE